MKFDPVQLLLFEKLSSAQREMDGKMVLPLSLGEWVLAQGNLSPSGRGYMTTSGLDFACLPWWG